MRTALFWLLIALAAGPAHGAQPLDETWAKWMKPRGDAVDQLAARTRTASHKGAEELIARERSRQTTRRAAQVGGGVLLVFLVFGGTRFWLGSMKSREDQRVRMVLDAARRRDEDRR